MHQTPCRSLTLLVTCALVMIALGLNPHSLLRNALAQSTEGTRKPLPKFLRSPVLADRYLSTRDVAEILEFERVEPVCLQLLKRTKIADSIRCDALERLAELRGTDPVAELLPWIGTFDSAEATDDSATEQKRIDDGLSVLTDLGQLLPKQSVADLQKHDTSLAELATQGRQPVTRYAAFAALMAADQQAEDAWQLTSADTGRVVDFLRAIPFVPTVDPRLYTRVRPLLDHADSRVQAAAIAAVTKVEGPPREVFETLCDLVEKGVQMDACVGAICDIPSDAWTPERRQPLASQLLAYLSRIALADRNQPAGRQTTRLLTAIADRLPSDQKAEVVRELERLSVQVIRIKTLEEQMAYDRTVLVARPGQGLQIVLENGDIMPHNLVVVDTPEAREEVGLAADAMQNEPDALQRSYLPDSPHILHATRLLYPQQSETLTFECPQQPGVYAYLCTFPGHWSKMYGALVITDDRNQFLAANAELPSADQLLGIRTVNWDYEELAAELPALAQGRSFENGQRMFMKASCFSCHKVRDQGGKIGPELTEISKKYTQPADILRQIMHPSEKVEEQYATVIVETSDGRLLRGVLISDDGTTVALNENPLLSCEPLKISHAEIEGLSRSRLSPMPEQLLNTVVEKQDVFDLLAYLVSGGNPGHAIFATP